MKKSLSCLLWAIVPTVSIFSYPIFHGIQSTMNSVEGLEGLGMILAAIATVLSAFAVGFISAKQHLPTWLPLCYLGYCLTSVILALLLESVAYDTAKLYLTALVFGCCLLAAGIGTLLGRSLRTLEDKKAA